MPALDIQYVVAFAVLVLPGAVFIYSYGLIVPRPDRHLKDRVLEALSISLVYLILTFPLTQWLIGKALSWEQDWVAWILGIVYAVLVPALLAVPFEWGLNFLERRRIISIRSQTAWDQVFGGLKQGCWLVVELASGERIGGRFDVSSYASSYPDPGHIYLEEVWSLTAEMKFDERLDGCPGILLTPDDYRGIYVYKSDEAVNANVGG